MPRLDWASPGSINQQISEQGFCFRGAPPIFRAPYNGIVAAVRVNIMRWCSGGQPGSAGFSTVGTIESPKIPAVEMMAEAQSKRSATGTSTSRPKAPAIDDLRPEGAVQILRRLAESRGAVGEAVRKEILAAVAGLELTAITTEVYEELDALSLEELWDRSGRTSRGYIDVQGPCTG